MQMHIQQKKIDLRIFDMGKISRGEKFHVGNMTREHDVGTLDMDTPDEGISFKGTQCESILIESDMLCNRL